MLGHESSILKTFFFSKHLIKYCIVKKRLGFNLLHFNRYRAIKLCLNCTNTDHYRLEMCA